MLKHFVVAAAMLLSCMPLEAFQGMTELETFVEYLKKTASETVQFNQNTANSWKEKLNRFQLKENAQNAIDKIEEIFSNCEETQNEPDNQTKQKRKFLESLGNTRVDETGQTLNDYARKVIKRTCPQLLETEYYQNPAKALSYFLVVDARGFAENVRIIRGPMGVQMTIKEAYQYYTRTDPEKADRILNMLELLYQLNNPDSGKKQNEIILEAIKETIELLNAP
ncbi:MAG: hypothetical protein EOM80_06515 [Erysipelotrichia bacterium]|nr:hypothetical protein [Erysipelotrichia bacterium]